MRRSIQREWVMLMRVEKGLTTYVYEPLRRKEIAIKLKRGWKISDEGIAKAMRR